jgi:site-specific DNA recombinase
MTYTKKNDDPFYALIYTRVSSIQQESEGSGLESQEQRCVKYAQSKSYIVDKEKIFHDTFSGGGDFMRRPAMSDLLNYIDNHVGKRYVVIFDDLKRFARDTKFHIELRSAFNLRKVKVECLNFNFEDTPEGNFVETILAAQNQLEREQNQRQVIQKQKARLENGYWAFHGPLGYTMQKVAGYSGKVAVPNEKSDVLREALEGYANLKFAYLINVASFLKVNKILGNQRAEKYIDTVKAIITNPFYAGYLEYIPWNVERRKGIHQALIDDSTYNKNLERLNTPIHATRIRLDDNPEFELRRLVSCIHCKKPFTAFFSKGRSDLYPYYICQSIGCVMNRKAIPRKVLHDDFSTILKGLKPSDAVIELFHDWFEECWKEASMRVNHDQSKLSENIRVLEEELDRYVELLATTKSEIVRIRYEKKIEEIANRISETTERSRISIDLSIPYKTALSKVINIAKDPYQIWMISDSVEKKLLYKFFFETNIEYDLKTRYQTVKPSILYRFFDDFAKKTEHVDIPRNLSNQFAEVCTFLQKWQTHPSFNSIALAA